MATEAARQVVQHAFRALDATCIYAGHNPSNSASRRTLLKLGFSHTHDELYPPTGLQHPTYVLRSLPPAVSASSSASSYEAAEQQPADSLAKPWSSSGGGSTHTDPASQSAGRGSGANRSGARRDPEFSNDSTRAHLYGFVAWIAIHVLYSLYLLWAHLPAHVLNGLGVTYHPDKHWALALPCYAIVTLVTIPVVYASYNLMNLPPLESVSTIVDEHSRAPEEREMASWSQDDYIPTIVDLPVTFVSNLMLEHAAETGSDSQEAQAQARARHRRYLEQHPFV